MHDHYAALVTANTADEATQATLALTESYGPNSVRGLYDSCGIGGRWTNTLTHAPDAPASDYSNVADFGFSGARGRPNGANLIRARSLRSPEFPPGTNLADEEIARAVANATRGLDVPLFPDGNSAAGFDGDFSTTRDSAWVQAAKRAWEATADGADHCFPFRFAPYLIDPDTFARFRDSFAHKNNLCGFIIETPSVFTHAPDGLLFDDDATAVYIPDHHTRRPSESLDTQEQMIRNLEPETTWIVSLDLHY